jgi:acyl-CoA synthetase (AMP-forming)/AMP-acid ligase II
MQERLGFQQVVNAYGLIEGTVVTMTRAGDPPEVVASTAGRPMPGVQVQITDDDGVPVAPGERGEVWVRGYGVMQGYWDAQELTAAAVDSDGWLRTGDVGVLDEQGNLAIVDRKKEMFIVGGFNAYPAEIENLLLGHPAIRSVAVIGIPDERLGEVCMAFVVLEDGADTTPDEIVTWSRDHMANYKAPRRVEILEALPLNATGKVMKEDLRARAVT